MLAGVDAARKLLLPETLRSRLALTVLLAILSVLLIMSATYLIANHLSRPMQESESASELLAELDHDIRTQTDQLDAALIAHSVSPRLYPMVVTGQMTDPALPAQMAEIALRTNAIALVLLDRDGKELASSGDREAIDDLVAVLADLQDEPSGKWNLALIDARTSAIAVRALVGSPAGAPAGTLAIAAPLSATHARSPASLTFAPPGTPAGANTRTIDNPAFGQIIVASGPSGFLLRADLPGLDGQSVGTAIFESPYAEGYFTSNLGSALALSLAFSVLVSTFVGLLIARVIGAPIGRLSEHMHTQSEAAAAGAAFSELHVDSRLPVEFRLLTESFNTMLRRFKEHESALASATEDAVLAKTSLDIAFTQSVEGKVLLYDGLIQLINPTAIAHFDLSDGESEGFSLTEVLHSARLLDEQEEVIDASELVDRVLEGTITIGVASPRRTTRWLRVTSVGSAREGTLLLSTHDVTEERRIDSLRTEIVSLVSHDLRAPLTVITGYLDLLSNDPEPTVRTKAIESARRSAVRMEDLLEDLLSATRAEEMFTPSTMEPINLTELSRDVAISLSHTSRHTITFRGSAVVTVSGEERRLRQVVVNLVSNALKYSPLDTLVTVTVTAENGRALVAIEDEGEGVAEEDREVIFERFTRLTTEGERRPGIGLGLYIVRRIAESHGGTVHVESGHRAGGACFVLSLPAVTLTR